MSTDDLTHQGLPEHVAKIWSSAETLKAVVPLARKVSALAPLIASDGLPHCMLMTSLITGECACPSDCL
jgi:hypothetical protein